MKKLVFAIVIVILIVAALLFWKPMNREGADLPESADTTENIEEDIAAIDVEGEFEADFESLEGDINSL